MANDYSQNSNVKAVWRFENNLLDSQNSYHLTGGGSPTYNSASPIEGEYSIDFEFDSSQYAYILDSALASDFPLASAGSVTSFTVLAKIRPESFATSGMYITSKYDLNSKRSFGLQVSSASEHYIQVWQSVNGTLGVTVQHASALIDGQTYYVAYTYDDTTGDYRIRVFDVDAGTILGTDAVGTWDGNIFISTAEIRIGSRVGGTYFDGLIDEVVWAAGVWSVEEIDMYFAGTYPGTEVIGFVSSIAASSTTNDIQVLMVRSLLANIHVTSTTPSIQAILLRGLAADVAAESSTPGISATLSRSLIAAIANGASTPEIQALIVRSLSASISATSSTSEISIQIIRSLIVSIIGHSTTPDIAATIHGIISFIASLSGVSTISDITAVVSRSMSADISGIGTTPEISAAFIRSLIADITNISSTPEIMATLQNVIGLVASVQGISITLEISADMARTLSAVVSEQSVTPDIAATVARFLLADIQGSSITPDDLILILAGMGIVIDPTLTSLTVQRSIHSSTVNRTIHSI